MQSKITKQRSEIARLTQEIEAVRNDLADIKAQRDTAKDALRMIRAHASSDYVKYCSREQLSVVLKKYVEIAEEALK